MPDPCEMESKVVAEERRDWHSMTVEETVATLDTDVTNGLSKREVEKRLDHYGPNRLREEKRKPAILRFLLQFNDFMVYVLLAAVVISVALLQEYLDGIVILVIVILNALLGFVQESRAESAMAELQRLSAPEVAVRRDGTDVIVPACDVVPGDLLIMETGDITAADARLVEAVNLRMNESSLTGESMAVEKDAGRTVEAGAGVGDRPDMVFAATHVEFGRGTAVVVETGQRTELGKIADLLTQGKARPTPLQSELHDVGRRIVYICLAVVVLVFIAGVVRGNEIKVMFLFAVSLAVAAIPEGLPAIVTITLARGMQSMARHNAIVRNLPAVETLGSADFICTDKTGTLTLNKMTVTDMLFADGAHYLLADVMDGGTARQEERFREMCLVGALCNDARLGAEGTYLGDPTEVAILETAIGTGIDRADIDSRFPRVAEVPFESERKMMTTVHGSDGAFMVASKGAVESLLARCSTIALPSGEVPLDDDSRKRVLSSTTELASQGLRTLGCASRRVDGAIELDSPEALENDLLFLGCFAMKDPPRPEVEAALKTCRAAGIDVAMITGDHRATAEAIARELGMLVQGRHVLEGKDIEHMTKEQLSQQVEDVVVYARVSPHHKVKIVESLQDRGHIVAMTGDGVNDSPALEKADIGIAMGITGTDVAKQASDMVLSDDNFATIVQAIRQGRVIFDNIKKPIYYLLSCNVSEVTSMFIAMLAGFPLPLIPAQVLWINLVTDGLPALALAGEPAEKGIMTRKPRLIGENILTLKKQGRLVMQGLILTAGALIAYMLSYYLLHFDWTHAGPGQDAARTVLFTTMVFAQVLHSYNWRSETRSMFREVPWANRFLFFTFFLSIGLQMAVIYLPFMQKAFHTRPPTAEAWGVILVCAFVPVILIDRLKVFIAWRERRAAKVAE